MPRAKKKLIIKGGRLNRGPMVSASENGWVARGGSKTGERQEVGAPKTGVGRTHHVGGGSTAGGLGA